MPTLSPETLERFSRAIFEAAGVPPKDAATIAEVLIGAHLAGHDSHGVIRIPQYCDAIRTGHYVPGAPIERIHETMTTAIYDANWNFGHVAMRHALDESIEHARETGLYAAGIRQCNHIGRLGHYTEIAAAEGFVGFLTVNSTGRGASVAPFGGKKGRLGTNPFSIAFPTEGDPILIDMTSSIVAEGKIRVRRHKGEPLPEGWILDPDGNPSTNPEDFYGPPRGAILPFGGPVAHKGFALSMMADLLAGTLTGAGNVMERDGHIGNGVFLLLIRVDAFRPVDEFRAAASRFGAYVKDCPPADGFDEVLLPGEPEARARRERSRSGILIDETTWEHLCAEAERYGVDVPMD